MRSCTFIFVVLATIFLDTKYTNAIVVCPKENCLKSDECEELTKAPFLCLQQEGAKCCSVVKSEFRTHCRHHGGECMDKCAMTLQRDAIDCMNQICCVLV